MQNNKTKEMHRLQDALIVAYSRVIFGEYDTITSMSPNKCIEAGILDMFYGRPETN